MINKILHLMIFLLIPLRTSAQNLNISISAGPSIILFKTNMVTFSDGDYTYNDVGLCISTQVSLKYLDCGFYPFVKVSYQPAPNEFSIYDVGVWVYERMVMLHAGLGKSFNIGKANLDLVIAPGWNNQIFYFEKFARTTKEHNSDICFLFGLNIRSPMFDKVYALYGCEYLHQKEIHLDGSFESWNDELMYYWLDAYNKKFINKFGLEIVF